VFEKCSVPGCCTFSLSAFFESSLIKSATCGEATSAYVSIRQHTSKEKIHFLFMTTQMEVFTAHNRHGCASHRSIPDDHSNGVLYHTQPACIVVCLKDSHVLRTHSGLTALRTHMSCLKDSHVLRTRSGLTTAAHAMSTRCSAATEDPILIPTISNWHSSNNAQARKLLALR
jgi:hypothetical protein